MRTFILVWLGQVVSYAGSQLTAFGLGVWLYQRTGSATLYSLNLLALAAPQILLSPVAGALVDRWDRRLILMVANAGAGLCSILLMILLVLDTLPVAVALTLVAAASAFSALEFPAFSAATTTLVSREQLGRANGLVQLGFAAGQIAAPLGGGLLLVSTGMRWLLAIDAATFAFALIVLWLVRIPRPADAEATSRRGLLEDMAFGLGYLRQQPGLLVLLGVFFLTNFNLGVVQVVAAPLVLGFADAGSLGGVFSAGGLGMLAGSLLMVTWGGPRRYALGALAFTLPQGVFLMLASARQSIPLVGAAAFGLFFTLALSNGCSQTLWQHVVPAHLQGRVFATRMMIARASMPLAYLVAGPLLDGFFGPALLEGGALSGSVGQVLGVGPGRGGALMLGVAGALTLALALGGMLNRELRRLDGETAAPQSAPHTG